jgi:ABC-type multidrug transport system ATPase subunit
MRITVESLSKRYGGVRALDGISFTIEPGQILAVLGVNGAGKTTLLRCFSGVVAGSGSISYDGERFTRGSMNLRRKIAFLPDFPIAFPHHTVLRHIGMVLRLYDADDSAVEPRVLERFKRSPDFASERQVLAYRPKWIRTSAIFPFYGLMIERGRIDLLSRPHPQ